MKAQELMDMAKGFEGIVKMIKSGEMSIEGFKESMTEMTTQIKAQIKMTEKLLTDENVTGTDAIMKMAIEEQLKEESINFNYKEHKRLVVTVMTMVHKMDVELNDELFHPFIEDIFKSVNGLLEIVNPEMAKAVRKAMKKSKKLIEAEASAQNI